MRLSYIADRRTIIDENGLAVARDVNPDDAKAIVSAVHIASDLGDGDPAKAIAAANAAMMRMDYGSEVELAAAEADPPLFAIIGDILAYKADEFDGASTWDVVRELETGDVAIHTDIRSEAEAERLADLDMAETGGLAYINEVKAGDLQVSGADLVDAFTQWRLQLRAALMAARPPTARALIAEMSGLIDDAIANHIYDESNGDVIPEDCPYQAAVDAATLWLAGGAPGTITLVLEGGCVQSVSSDHPLPDLKLVVIDYDTDDADRSELDMVVQSPDAFDHYAKAHVCDYSFTTGPFPATLAIISADDPRFDDHFDD